MNEDKIDFIYKLLFDKISQKVTREREAHELVCFIFNLLIYTDCIKKENIIKMKEEEK